MLLDDHSTTLTLSDAFGFLLAALFGSLHCIGMCGSFVVAAGCCRDSEPRVIPWRFLRAQSLYHAGKTMSYLFLVAIVGALGQHVGAYGAAVRLSLSVGAALLIALIALSGFGWDPIAVIRPRSRNYWARFASLWIRAGSTLARSPSRLKGLFLGMLSGFLPCPLVYAFLAAALARGSVLFGALIMVALGLGTVPALWFVGVSGRSLQAALRSRWRLVSCVLLLLLSAYTLYRGVAPPVCCE